MFYIGKKCWDKLQQWAQLAYDEDKNEISGMLILEKDDQGHWRLHSPDIMKQENSATLTVLDKDAIRDWAIKQATKYGTDSNKVRYVWWHSHHTMAANWSGTDDKEIEAAKETGVDWSVSLLINLKEEYKLKLAIWEPVETLQDVELIIVDPKKPATEAMKKKYKELCSNSTPALTRNYNNNIYSKGWGAHREEAIHFDKLIDAIDNEFQQILNGQMEPKAFNKKADKYNKSETSKKCGWSIKHMPKDPNKAMDKAAGFPFDMVKFKDPTVKLKYEREYGCEAETNLFNSTYYGWNNGVL